MNWKQSINILENQSSNFWQSRIKIQDERWRII